MVISPNFIKALSIIFLFTELTIQQSSLTTQDIINDFYQNYTKAMKYKLNFYLNYFLENNEENLYSIFFDENQLTKYFYKNNTPAGYIISFPNSSYVFFKIMINPCKNFKQFCCDGLAICQEDNPEIIAGGDLEIAWSTNNLIPLCANEFNNSSCGMFLEIHMPGNPNILTEFQINKYYINGFDTIFITTKKLCSGRYEFWLVSRMRAGKFLNYVKPIHVKYPSCTCEHVSMLGYSCN